MQERLATWKFLITPHKSCLNPCCILNLCHSWLQPSGTFSARLGVGVGWDLCTVQWFSDGTWEVCACVCVCLFIELDKKITRAPSFQWEVVFAERCQKTEQYFAMREMLPNKM